jgi:hypothetical protein
MVLYKLNLNIYSITSLKHLEEYFYKYFYLYSFIFSVHESCVSGDVILFQMLVCNTQVRGRVQTYIQLARISKQMD